ncbi:hypothetical protein RvY_15267-2 [Ramazzottius varieornatus]|uniref:Uncharacterized protein n=1 Tax=Ramazzottius varieornatus TaxID=947166 RepID=A0A1D1VVX5_RAMVA|nr:hypothetical protein RvY_15267-2 [Ramazzottius varieornatus]
MRLEWSTIVFLTTSLSILYSKLGSANEEQAQLVRDLFRNYNPLLRPVLEENQTVTISFSMSLTLIIYLNERHQVLKTNGYTVLEWHDPQLSWDIGDYGGTTAIRMPVEKVWTPDVVLLTNTDGKFGPSYKSNAVIYSAGIVNWMPPFIYKSSCQVEVKNFPFDQQECVMRFSSWTYTALEVDLQPKQIVVDVTNYMPGGIWDLVDARIHRMAYDMHGHSHSYDSYGRVDILVTIVMRRKALFYTVNLLIPTVLISFMTVFVFLLPTVAGEKTTLTISLTLSIVVFLLLVSKILPPANAMPLISKFLLFTFAMNLISVTMTVITINVNYRGPKTHDMNWFLRAVFLKFLPKVFLMKRPPKRFIKRRIKQRTKILACEVWQPLYTDQSGSTDPNRSRGTNLSRSAPFSATTFTDRSALPGPSRARQATPSRTLPFSLSLSPRLPLGHVTFEPSVSAVTTPEPPSAPIVHFDDCEPDCDLDVEPRSSHHPDRLSVVGAVDYIAGHLERNDRIKEIEEDWRFMALVIDRVLLWIFFWITCAGSVAILMDSEHLFTHIDESATVRRLSAMLR